MTDFLKRLLLAAMVVSVFNPVFAAEEATIAAEISSTGEELVEIVESVVAEMPAESDAISKRKELIARVKEASKSKPCLFFESYGKYPHAIVYYPKKNEVKDILFACDKDDSVDFVEDASDFANLIPAKVKVSWPLCGIYTEKKYKGFVADKPVMMALSSNNHEKSFKKPFMVAEYESGMDMKWTFESVEQFQAFKTYFLKNINSPANVKPFLVLEIDKDYEALTEDDVAFLDQYFDLADLSDSDQEYHALQIDDFIKQASHDVEDYAKHEVGKGFTEILFEDLLDNNKDGFGGFEFKKIAARTTKWLVAALTIVVLTKTVDKIIEKKIIEKVVKAV